MLSVFVPVDIHYLFLCEQQEKVQIRKELWRIEDVIAGLSSSKANYKVTISSVTNPGETSATPTQKSDKDSFMCTTPIMFAFLCNAAQPRGHAIQTVSS